jgi:ribonuclease HI
MNVPAPHFLLYAEAAQAADLADSHAGRWRFVLRLPGGETSLEAADDEPAAGPERLELLAIVRGLEALESPSRVTLLTGSRHVRRGLEFGLSQWRENDWQWERYGRMTPIKNGDLWQRLDRLLEIHAVRCQGARLEKADDLASPAPAAAKHTTTARGRHLRIDAAEAHARQSEIRNPKSETNSEFKGRNVRNGTQPRHLNFLLSNLLRISDFVLRSLTWSKPSGTQQVVEVRFQ